MSDNTIITVKTTKIVMMSKVPTVSYNNIITFTSQQSPIKQDQHREKLKRRLRIITSILTSISILPYQSSLQEL